MCKRSMGMLPLSERVRPEEPEFSTTASSRTSSRPFRIDSGLLQQFQKVFLLAPFLFFTADVEKELNQSRALLAGVLNSSLDGIAAFEAIRDRWGRIIDFRWLTFSLIDTKDKLKGNMNYQELLL